MSFSDWREVRIGEVISFNPSESLKKGEIAKKIAMEQLEPFTRKIANYELSKFTGGSKFRNGDTLFARITPCLENGKTAYVNILDDNEVAFGSTEFIVMRKKEKITDDMFVYYLAISPDFRNKAIQSMTGTSGRQRVQQDVLQSHKIMLPPLHEQKAIAATLSALDDMIELNNQINKTLEEMAQAIFKSWFVDFEPFKDGEFEESELGLIPKGWRVGAIDELIKETISGDWGKETPQGNYTEKVICIRGADIPDIAQGRRGNPATRYILKRNLEKKRLSENEIIIEISGGSPTQSTGRTVFITKELINSFQEPIICTNFCRTVRLKEATYSSFVYSLLQYLYNEKVFFTYENGTTGIKNLDITTLFGQYKTVIPSEEVFAEYHSMYSEFLRYIYESGFECKKLSEIRETLLPKLMSGEIRVPVEEVV